MTDPKALRIGLFTSGDVGLGVVNHFREKGVELACLALDSKDRGGRNSDIRTLIDLPEERIFYSRSIYDAESIARMQGLQLDLVVLAWWTYILKKPVLGMPRLGTINLHPSYLPYNRGRDAKYWTIIEDCPFGATIHYIDEGVDSGDIIFQRKIEKTWEDTGQSLADRSEAALVSLFEEHFDAIVQGRLPRRKQALELGSFHKKAEAIEHARIDLDAMVRTRDLLNRLRAKTSDHERGAWFEENGERYEVHVRIKRIDST